MVDNIGSDRSPEVESFLQRELSHKKLSLQELQDKFSHEIGLRLAHSFGGTQIDSKEDPTIIQQEIIELSQEVRLLQKMVLPDTPNQPEIVSDVGTELIAKEENFRIVGVDTFDGDDWVIDEVETLKEAMDIARSRGGTMLKTHVYDSSGRHRGEGGSF